MVKAVILHWIADIAQNVFLNTASIRFLEHGLLHLELCNFLNSVYRAIFESKSRIMPGTGIGVLGIK